MTQVNDQDRFPTSGRPTYLEAYKCFFDTGQRRLIDGQELKDNEGSWDEKQRAKWHFFYRPVESAIGRPQRRRVTKIGKQISRNTRKLEQLTMHLWRDLALCFLGAIFVGLAWGPALVIAPLVIALFRIPHARSQRRELATRNEQLGTESAQLEVEIEELRKQVVTSPPSAEEVEGWLAEEIRAMERKCLAEIINTRSDDPRLFEAVRHEPVEERNNPYGLHGLLVAGWGLLQPSSVSGLFGKERTAVRRIAREIKGRIATWKHGSTGQPLYRVLYLQYIFLLEKNINVYGFFYDFLTRKQYGKFSETFQYNHVTNYSIRQVDLDDDWAAELKLEAISESKLLEKEYSAFSMAVSSSAHFRCVLSDDTVVDAINQWLEADETLREHHEHPGATASRSNGGSGPREDGEHGVDGEDGEDEGGDSFDGMTEEEKEAILRELAEHRDKLEEQDVHLARRALQQVREEVENYVHPVQSTGPELDMAGE